MEKNDKSKYGKGAIISTILTLAIIASSCASFGEDVTVKEKEKKEEKALKPTIAAIEETTWINFDENVGMYKVDLDKFLRDKLKLSEIALENDDVINLIALIRDELGEDFYTKDKNDNRLYNLEGKSVTINASFEREIIVKFYGNENTLRYEITVSKDGKTYSMSRSRETDSSKVAKYFIIYSGGKEYTRTILLRENNEKYLSISLHEGNAAFDPYSISFDTDIAEASIKLSKEDYECLHEIMLSYSDSDNLYEFLRDNLDLLNKYLDLVKVKNAEYYEYLCSLIGGYIEEAKIIRYE